MSRSTFLSISLLLLLSAAPANKENLKTLDFSTDPGWDQYRNHLIPNPPPKTKQDFGYRTSNKAGGQKPGEIGGRAQRSATPASYAKVIETKTLNDKISASGKFSVTWDDNGNGILFGFFNQNSKGWRASNSMVFRLDGNGMKYWVLYEYGTQHWLAGGAGCFEGDAYQTTKTKPMKSDGTSHDWKLDYDPDGADGKGLITFTLDGRPWKLALTEGHKHDGATFNRFGILNQQTTGGQIEAWYDDLVINGEAENFDNDPKWEAIGNQVEYEDRIRRPNNDYGWSPKTTHAGSGGEIGGLLWRDDKGTWYADKVGPFTLDDELYASGKIAFTHAGSDGGASFGYFSAETKKAELAAKKTTDVANILAIHIEGPSRIGHYFNPVFANSKGEHISPNEGPILRPDGKIHDWVFHYQPNPDGTGTITVTLDDKPRQIQIPAAQRKVGATLDHFGFFSHANDGNHVIFWIDDLTYTAKK
ncbi:MAG TPA: hypothetical protein VGQ99_15315 [Tepidisphaeraceae bacterium]|nr:hypothetical protein [Tepidisphaeraceae bacterium]